LRDNGEILTIQFQRNHQEIKFPFPFVNPISEVAEIWHGQIVAVKLRNFDEAKTGISQG
jgi:hypothetical protein